MNDQIAPDAPTLRRIALLVMRAGQDDEALRRPMSEICALIDALKEDVALGLPLDRNNVVRLSKLIDRLARERASPGNDMIHGSILGELDDLGRTLCGGAGRSHGLGAA